MTGNAMPSTALVSTDDMAAVESLDPQARELAVTQMLSEARSWLTQALETSEPASIANFKAQMATVAEATKQLGLSKEIQLDAVEMVRRAERGVGLAVRKGQAEGTINTKITNLRRGPEATDSTFGTPTSPSEFMLAGTPTHETYAMTDDVSDEEFEAAIAEAKAEENLSRANVVRKVKKSTRTSDKARLDRIAELAAKAWTSDQIGKEIGHHEETVRRLARAAGININADRALRGMHRRIDHNRIASQTVTALEGLVIGLQLLNIHEVDLTHADEWVTSLNASLRSLNRFRTDLIKEMTPHDN
jgi:DNA-binding NarL/FixJ family response regulator